jgi:ligand-binding SRPBCC domain-containing protein
MITIKKHSGIYTLNTQQILPIELKEAWNFFSNPANLEKITPQTMGFKITSIKPEKAYPGQIITYKIGILPGITANWVTEITQVEQEKYFVDEQRYGPYSMWHHEHRFENTDDGVIMTDSISYKIPFGPIGHLMHQLFIQSKLKEIFTFRRETLKTFFSKTEQ